MLEQPEILLMLSLGLNIQKDKQSLSAASQVLFDSAGRVQEYLEK